MPNRDIWGNINTLFEIGVEIYRLMHQSGNTKGESNDTAVEKIADGVLLMTDDKNVIIAVSKDAANQSLSETAREIGVPKGDYLSYTDPSTVIPIF
jgi:hypothetical protein